MPQNCSYEKFLYPYFVLLLTLPFPVHNLLLIWSWLETCGYCHVSSQRLEYKIRKNNLEQDWYADIWIQAFLSKLESRRILFHSCICPSCQRAVSQQNFCIIASALVLSLEVFSKGQIDVVFWQFSGKWSGFGKESWEGCRRVGNFFLGPEGFTQVYIFWIHVIVVCGWNCSRMIEASSYEKSTCLTALEKKSHPCG